MLQDQSKHNVCLSISRCSIGKMVGLSSFPLKPVPSLLSDAISPVCPLCETGASDAAVTISAKQASR